MKISIQQKLFSDKDKERISNELLNGIGAQPTPQPVVKKRPCEMNEDEKREYDRLRVAKYRKNNPDKVKLTQKKSREKNKLKRLVLYKSWVARNPDRRKESTRRCYNKNKTKYYEAVKDRNRIKYLNNPAKYRLIAKEKEKKLRDKLSNCYIRQKLLRKGITDPTPQLIMITKIDLIQTRLDRGTLSKELTAHYLNIINQLKQEVLCS